MSTPYNDNFTADTHLEDSVHPEHSFFTLPKQLSSDYTILSCLKYSEQSSTYLLRQISSGKTALLKTTGDFLFTKTLINEKNILDFIHQQDDPAAGLFPKNLKVVQTQDGYCYLRTYIEGTTLEELCESNLKKPGMSVSLALNYIIQLTELLQFLHTRKPPIIHRDIKPQNIIVDSTGVCHFIDMGISRFFDSSKKSDTLIMGTRITAPPEQFGYHQTDIRSDLYSLGIVLYYCLTGEYTVKERFLSELDPAVAKIIQKATRFDPDKRYQTTQELLPDLLSARYRLLSPPRISRPLLSPAFKFLLLLLLSLNLLLAGAFFYQREMLLSIQTAQAVSDAQTASPVYTFSEPLIEEAVREILNIPEAAITEKDLEKVTSLHIMGLQIFSDDSEIWFQGAYPFAYSEEFRETELYLQTGSISSLEDILYMPNLKTLSLYKQQISDLSLLKDTKIENLGIGYNPLGDLSPLAGNTSIKYLNLSDTQTTDTDVSAILSTLSSLEELKLGATDISSVSGLENCPLKNLDLSDLRLIDYSSICQLSSLEVLELQYFNQEILNTLSGLPLKSLTFRKSQNITLDMLSVFPELEYLFFAGNSENYLEVSNPNLPKLQELNLQNIKIKDFYNFSSLTSLYTLHIYSAECESFDGLDQIPNLRYINGTDSQKDLFLETWAESNYLFLP